jgi:hypothetical protein
VTFRYVTGWASEDRWEPMTLARLTAATLVHRDDDDDDDGATYRHLLTFGPHGWQDAQQLYKRLFAGKERPTFVRWLGHMAAEYFAQGCRCEHDCCGHMQAYASLRYLGRRRFSVERRTYPNV